jgi:hypothetical protein
MTVDKWLDGGGMGEARQESAYSIHDRIGGIQSMALTRIMNPTTLRRVLDNEYRTPADQDMITLPELLDTVSAAVWSELEKSPSGSYTARKPYISSLRRNLQREHLDRMIELSMGGGGSGEAAKAISNLSVHRLRMMQQKIDSIIGAKGDKGGSLDAYSLAHLSEAKLRIEKALDAQYIYNGSGGMGGMFGGMFFGQPTNQNMGQNTEQTPANLMPVQMDPK